MGERLRPLRLATRGSRLALWQADRVATALEAAHAAVRVEIQPVRTRGDALQDVPLAAVGGSAFFTREIESALLAHEADLAVHSLKDLASVDPAGLRLGAVLRREDARDAWVAREGRRLADLSTGARIGTGSVRRQAFLRSLRPDLELVDLRGNVPTRLAKLADGSYDAIILAAAGLVRLGLEERITEFLDPRVFVPPAGQGAIAVQLRSGDALAADLVGALDHSETRQAVDAERAFLAAIGAGCQAPVGVNARLRAGRLELRAAVVSLDGRRRVDAVLEEPSGSAATDLGRRLAASVLERGGGDLLEEAADGRAEAP